MTPILPLMFYFLHFYFERTRAHVVATEVTTSAAVVESARPFRERLEESIATHMQVPVVLHDILGEGEGHWDKDPRYPVKEVNCMVWLQLVLADAYGANDAERRLAMDKIRYFGGEPSFSLRKHYTEHFLSIEAEPFLKVDLTSTCGQGKTHTHPTRIEPEVFLKSKGFGCALYRQDAVSFDVEYLRAKDLAECIPKLPQGHYAVFAVPTKHYEQKYLAESGSMGLVHAMVLNANGTAVASEIVHASTSLGRVEKAMLPSFLERMAKLHLGYALYKIDESWDFKKPATLTDAMRALTQCERDFTAKGIQTR